MFNLGHLKNLNCCPEGKSFLLSRNFPLESHRKTALLTTAGVGGVSRALRKLLLELISWSLISCRLLNGVSDSLPSWRGKHLFSVGMLWRDELRWSACFRHLRFWIFKSVFRGDVWHGAFRCGRCFRPLNSRICVMFVTSGVLPEHRHLFFKKIYFRCEFGLWFS